MVQGRAPGTLRHGQVGKDGRVVPFLAETHLVETAVGLPFIAFIQAYNHGFLYQQLAVHRGPDLVTLGIVQGHHPQLHMVQLVGDIAGITFEPGLEIQCVDGIGAVPDGQHGFGTLFAQQVHLHEMRAVLPAHQETCLETAGTKIHVIIDIIAGAVFRKMGLSAGNPSGA